MSVRLDKILFVKIGEKAQIYIYIGRYEFIICKIYESRIEKYP